MPKCLEQKFISLLSSDDIIVHLLPAQPSAQFNRRSWYFITVSTILPKFSEEMVSWSVWKYAIYYIYQLFLIIKFTILILFCVLFTCTIHRCGHLFTLNARFTFRSFPMYCTSFWPITILFTNHITSEDIRIFVESHFLHLILLSK
jgi:hypothetical protein